MNAPREKLNPEQKRAAEAPFAPLLIVAGAGTGKTRTLTQRLLFLIESGIVPETILALTFTNKAAKEMMERLEESLLGIKDKPYVGTFHSLGARILRAEAKHLGRTPDFVIFDDHDSFDLVKKLIKEFGFSIKDQKPSEFARYISQIKNGSETKNIPGGVSGETMKAFYSRYEEALARHNAFDFDDLLQKLVFLWKENPEILKKYKNKFLHILVDEYQDLNDVQYEFIRLLSADSGKISVVGDAAQTIYTWRGSNINIFLNFEKDWGGAQVVLLGENYRSSSNIIGAASGVLLGEQTLSPNLKYKLWTKNPAGVKVKLLEAANEVEEAEWIADQITNRVARSTNYENKAGETSSVLYRTNAQSRPIEQALLKRGIAYRVFGGMRFYERREIKDILAGLRYALNNKDEISKERLLKTIRKTRFNRFVENLKEGGPRSPLELIKLFLRSTDYLAYLDQSLTEPEERKENIAELIHFAGSFTELPPLLEQIALLQTADNLNKRKDAGADSTGSFDKAQNKSPQVILSTIHLAKGLEFDNVFVAGVKEGLLPHGRSFYDEEALEEERRLLYVAMTRARKELTLSFYEIPSRFLSSLPEENISYENLGGEGRVDLDAEERYISID
ncbi:MAG: UvrD-helicase domain-containing protein [Candidatus Liptonbacteria bacterium]|nr:UvrD-helicase domain-containing protein [Candidatus Liptonbacteria bacterium]